MKHQYIQPSTEVVKIGTDIVMASIGVLVGSGSGEVYGSVD